MSNLISKTEQKKNEKIVYWSDDVNGNDLTTMPRFNAYF